MKYLNQFLKFAADPFFAGKVLTVTGFRAWLDHDTKAKDGMTATNLYEKVPLKMEGKPSVSIGDSVLPINPVCTIYGDYRNQLSVRCDNVVVAAPTAGKDKA